MAHLPRICITETLTARELAGGSLLGDERLIMHFEHVQSAARDHCIQQAPYRALVR